MLIAVLLMVKAFVVLAAVATVVPIDAATLAAILFGVVSPFLFRAVPLKDNAMIAFTWVVTFLFALIAVVAIDQLQGIAFSWARLIIDIGGAYAIQAGIFTAAKHNIPAAVV